MSRVEETVEVHAPIETVFAQVTDPRRVPEWNPSVIEVHGVDYPVRVGTTWEQTVSVLGRMTHLSCQVVRYDPPHEGEIEVSGDLRARLWTRCSAGASATRLTQGIEFEPPGGRLRSIVGKAATATIRHELRATMSRQRETLEREAGGSDGSGT